MPSRSERSSRVQNHGRLLTPARMAVATLLGGLGIAGGGYLAFAQQQPAIQQLQVDDGGVRGKESTEPVYVRDSATAREKMDLAERMERVKEWHKSADVYQEVLEKYSDRVVPYGLDAKGVINRYTSVKHQVRQKLCKWPQEGLDVYRGRYEPRAAELVRSAGPQDLFLLHKAFDLYFVTDSGKQAGLRLIDAHLDGGEYAAAAWIADL